MRNDLDTYQIYYYSEYGDVNPLNKLTYTYEDENITLYAPVNSEEGKYFLGWYTTPDFENGTKITYIGSGSYGDITLYAKWISCVVENAEGFNIDYNTDSLPTLYMVVQNSSSIVTLSSLITVSSNCSWSLSTDIEGINEIKTRNVSLKDVGHNYYYLTVWYDDNYNLVYLVDIYKLDMFAYSFVSNGEVLKEENIEENSLISKIEDPSKTGYTFKGWSIDGENLVEFPYKATSSVSFNAVFVPNKYSISLDYDNNVDESQTMDVYYDQSVSLPNPEKYGHTFIGWEDINTHKIIDNSFIYNYESSISLKAVYKPNNYIIYVDTDNDGEYDNSYDVTFGEEYTIDSSSSDGHTFTGWTDKDGNVVDSNYTHLIDNDLYISANWDIINYAIKYNLNGGTNSSKNPNSYTYNDRIVFDEATKVGYTFKGWFIDSNFNTQITGIDVGSIGNKELYAKFVPNQYSLVVKDLDNKTISSSNVYYDSNFIIPEAISKTGYTFKGWQDQNGNQYTPNAEIIWNFTENITLTPIFEINKYNVVVEIDDLEAVVVKGDGVYEYNQDITLSVIINDGYIFLGWYDENDEFISRDKTLSISKIDKEYKYYVKTYKLDENGCYIYDGVKYKINDNDISVVGYVEGITTANILEEFINKKVTSIESNAFYGCSTLTSITIPSSVTSIGESTFYGCSSLISITIPSKVTSIGSQVFYGCSSLLNVTIPNSVTSIGSNAFYKCSSLTSITIPSSVTSIGSDAFYKCSSLEKITLPFIGGSKESNQYLGYIFGASSYSSNSSYVPSSLKEVIILDGCNSIGYDAFYNCSSLTSITIPNSVTSIGSNAFYKCSSLQYNEYDKGLYLGNNDNPYLVLVQAKDTSITSCIVNKNTTIIANGAFGGCDSLETITLPFIGGSKESNQYLGYIFGASSYSSNSSYVPSSLKEVIILDGCTSIGSCAFEGCSSLTSIIIPNSVTEIGRYAFSGCSSLQYNQYNNGLYLGNSENPYLVLVKAKDKKITYCTINENTILILGYAFYECRSLTWITIPNSVTSIGDYAFCYCTSLTSITISSSVTSIGSHAFCNCSSLTSIIIPCSVTSIGSYAFSRCRSLTIYCEVSSEPSGWKDYWNDSGRPVYWGVEGE